MTGIKKLSWLCICATAGLLIITDTRAMERVQSPHVADEFVPSILNKAPLEIWHIIAPDLPGHNLFLNDLSRLIVLPDTCYTAIVKELASAKAGNIPLNLKLEIWISSFFQTNRYAELPKKMYRAFIAVARTYPIPPTRGLGVPDNFIVIHSLADRNLLLAVTKYQIESVDTIKDAPSIFCSPFLIGYAMLCSMAITYLLRTFPHMSSLYYYAIDTCICLFICGAVVYFIKTCTAVNPYQTRREQLDALFDVLRALQNKGKILQKKPKHS